MPGQERPIASKEFEKASVTMEDIQRDLQVMRADVSRLAQQMAGLLSTTGSDALREVKAQMSRARQSLDSALADASERGKHAVDTVRQRADTALDELEDSVRRRPFASLALALGLGFLVGAIWRR
jgi:ElaB/YqjD/DUF883 family membrane-anchored ribosome-binding protein